MKRTTGDRTTAMGLALGALLLAGCGGDDAHTHPEPQAALADVAACEDDPGFDCGFLEVPLDHDARTPGTLRLAVMMSSGASGPRGDLLILAGGPGQPSAEFLPDMAQQFPAISEGYRWVALDQRGTGANALQCPALQAMLGDSDLLAAEPADVAACGQALGESRRFHGTADTVRDLDLLREAIGAERFAINGVSYGTYVATQYAMRYPDRVSALVLDSVVPHTGLDPFQLANLRATGDVLREACAQQDCTSDPAADLAAVVAVRDDSVPLLHMIVSRTVGRPRLDDLPPALAEARAGNPARLDAMIAESVADSQIAAEELSQGLHNATLCVDTRMPWGDSATPMALRQAALDAAAAGIAASQAWPFDVRTALGQGLIQNCLPWPPTEASAVIGEGRLPDVPTLLLNGSWDLSTPLDDARAQAALAPRGQLIVVPQAGHSVQSSRQARDIVVNFLCGGEVRYPSAPVVQRCG